AGRQYFVELLSSFEAEYFVLPGELVDVLQEVACKDAFGLVEGHFLLVVHQGFDDAFAGYYTWAHVSDIFVSSSFIRTVVSRNCRLRRTRISRRMSALLLLSMGVSCWTSR